MKQESRLINSLDETSPSTVCCTSGKFHACGSERTILKFSYDVKRWNFRDFVESTLQWNDLEQLHKMLLPDPVPPRKIYGGCAAGIALNSLMLAEKLRNSLTPEMLQKFSEFIYEVLPPLVGRVIRHQKNPVMRVHMHGGHSISGFHRDRDWGQKPNVLNLWIPFTDVWDSNSIWIEPEVGMGNPKPVALSYGEALIFPGADLLHGSIRNQTGRDRVSCDVRFALG